MTLWPLGAEPGTEGVVTLEHLGLLVIVTVLTAALARNVPALLEMLLLQLPIQPGARYALTSMSRYALVFSGGLAVFGVLGVSWSSVQWLVAAFGVGLGFGLQRVPTPFVRSYTLRASHLELGGVDLDLAVEDDVLPLNRADVAQQVGLERENPARRPAVRSPGPASRRCRRGSASGTSTRSSGRRPRGR